MKAKTIVAILSKRFANYLESIEDEAVRKIVADNSIITGGSIVSMLCNENISDFDIYFRTPDAAEAVAHYYVKKLLESPPPCFKNSPTHTVKVSVLREDDRVKIVVKSAGVAGTEQPQENYQYFEGIPDSESAAQEAAAYVEGATANIEALDEEPGSRLEQTAPEDPKAPKRYRVLFVTSNAITLANKVQLVIRFTGEPDEIHKNYDFVHCTNYWTSWDKKLTLRKEALEAILSRELRYTGSRYPICSMIRTRKFIKRGWTINAGQFVKMAWQVSELDLKDVNVLEEQLVGVDAAYFGQLIELLRKSEHPDKVDGNYLMTIIDRLF